MDLLWNVSLPIHVSEGWLKLPGALKSSLEKALEYH
jgi:hypothetical protein